MPPAADGSRPWRRNQKVVIRIAVYAVALVLVFAIRGRVDWGLLAHRLTTAPQAADSTLTVGGADNAPLLIDTMIRRYSDDYPRLTVARMPGTTAQALEDLLHRRADAAFLSRPPTRADQAAFRKASGDTAVWYPVSLGALLVVGAPDFGDSAVTLDELRARAFAPPQRGRRLYAVDRNAGTWDAFVERLGGAPAGAGETPGAYFLANEDSVLAYALHDRGALGVVSVFPLRRPLSAWGTRALAVRDAPDSAAVRADNVTLATSAYPLWGYVYLACLRRGSTQGATFLTYVTGPRGQRQIEATPYLPAEKILREVVITRPEGGQIGAGK